MTQQKETKTIIKTFDNDIYIINGKTPDEIQKLLDISGDMVRMPNGSYIHKKSISGLQSYDDYSFQTEQKVFHKKGYHIKNGSWNDTHGPLGIKANLDRITGDMKLQLSDSNKKLIS